MCRRGIVVISPCVYMTFSPCACPHRLLRSLSRCYAARCGLMAKRHMSKQSLCIACKQACARRSPVLAHGYTVSTHEKGTAWGCCPILGEGISFYGVCKTNVLGGVVLRYIVYHPSTFKCEQTSQNHEKVFVQLYLYCSLAVVNNAVNSSLPTFSF